MAGSERYTTLKYQDLLHYIEHDLHHELKVNLSLDDVVLLLRRDRAAYLKEIRHGLGNAVAGSPAGWPYENIVKAYLDQEQLHVK